MRTFLVEVLEQLLVRHGATERIDLNDIAEVIGARAVSYDEVDELIAELERRGCAVGGPPSVRELELLRQVLQAARALRGSLGRHPTVDEIGAHVGHPAFVVRRALENAGALGRG